ncbi:MAG: TetR/AcrR family transcriptional regulator [Solirubrobacterales bacterium]
MAVRSYNQVARAEATEQTRRAVLDAAQALFREEERYDFPLDAVAERAGISTRTLLRHFRSRDGLFEEALADAQSQVVRSRDAAPGDVAGAIKRLVDHYEELGDEVLRLLAAAEQYPLARRAVESGERMHREWVREIFAADLQGLGRGARERRLALLGTVTDVYVWRLLRRTHRLGRAATEASIRDLVEHARTSG